MSILQEIYKWSQGLSSWQKDAIARLYENRELSQDDIEDIYALLKSENGIIDPKNRTFSKLSPEQVAAPEFANRLVQLAKIRNLKNVNALAEGQSLPINITGLTIIYGENGTGKSGYSRVLKRACRARDKREPILPNANTAPIKVGPAQAIFDLYVDGQYIEVEWFDGVESPEQLSAIAIFDAHCARAYVDNHGDFAYSPYGLDILESLVKVCGKMRNMALKEQAENKANFEPFAALTKTATTVGNVLLNLSYQTKPEHVEALATLSEVEQERLKSLSKTLLESDPKQKAQTLQLRASRFAKLVSLTKIAISNVSDDKVKNLRELIDKSITANEVAELAAKSFKETPGLLPGTGGEVWKKLFEAARAFAVESHPGRNFPNIGADAFCPLCQNTLGANGEARIISFDTFIHQEAEKLANVARQSAMAAYKAIEDVNLDLSIDEPLYKELESSGNNLQKIFSEMQKSLFDRRTTILEAVRPDGNWDSVTGLSENPSNMLDLIASQLQAEAKSLVESLDEEAKTAMVAEYNELDARQRLSELKGTVLDAINKLVLIHKLQVCIEATSTMAISRKSTDLAKSMATPEVAKALNQELQALNVHELQIVMKNESPLGKAQFKLALELPGGGSPASILSEGEQRAIAIASFLAEINLGGGKGGIVFDDPVSSLDHRRRWHVAKRLAIEATHRQVIVFTHDIYFLCILQQEADAVGLDPLTQCIRKAPTGFGVQTDRLPFDTLSTSKRVSALRVMHDAIDKAYKTGDENEVRKLTHNAYHHLRLAWERGVEEVLFQGVVTRFGEGISTKMLRKVVVEDEDYTAINIGMTKSSKFEHDPAANALLPTPHPDELKADIENLEQWRSNIEKRKAVIEARRI